MSKEGDGKGLMKNIWHKFLHLFGRHRYFVVEEFSFECRKLGCKLCKKTFAMNDHVKALLEWDSDFEELYYGKHAKDHTQFLIELKKFLKETKERLENLKSDCSLDETE